MVDIPTVPITDAEDEDRFSVIRLHSLVKHHHLILRETQDVIEGRTPNLMLFCPPGSAKSTYVDVVSIPWVMATRPRYNVILASYATPIARKQGRRARQLVKSRSFSNLLGVGLSADSSAADEWKLTNGSEFMAGGLLSGITGNRAALGVLDDVVAGREEAESETIRNKTWDAYQDDFCSRLIPGAPQIIITTRWSMDDVPGRILPEDWAGESGMFEGRDGRIWKVVCMPAIAEHRTDPLGRAIGESLWPEWFKGGHWDPFKKNPRSWNSLYQQRPAPDEGTFFQRAWFPEWTERPKGLAIYGTSDYAVTDGDGDYTVHRVWGVDHLGDIYRLGGWRGQKTTDVWIDAQLDLIRDFKPICWFGEAGVIAKAVNPALTRRMRERAVYCRMEWLPSIHDKATRARGFQARAASGRVKFEKGADLTEFLQFPAGKHDDEVDNASLIGRALDDAHPGILPSTDKGPRKPTMWDRAFGDRDEADNWKVA